MPDNKVINRASWLSKLNIALILLVIVVAAINESRQDQIISAPVEPTVDFSVSDIQRLSNGLLSTQASQKKHLTGVKFSGRIINTLSVDHNNVTFSLSVDGKSKEFTITKISSGHSTGFSVYIPDLELEYARYAQVEFVRGRIGYGM